MTNIDGKDFVHNAEFVGDLVDSLYCCPKCDRQMDNIRFKLNSLKNMHNSDAVLPTSIQCNCDIIYICSNCAIKVTQNKILQYLRQ